MIVSVTGACVVPARAAGLPDEIQVFADEAADPGEIEGDLHFNTTRGRPQPARFPGEAQSDRGVRLTPEITYGVSASLQVSLHLPLVYTAPASGVKSNFALAGYKLEAKWMPVQYSNEAGKLFIGSRFEYSNIAPKFDNARQQLEVRPIAGWRGEKWLFAGNAIFKRNLSRDVLGDVDPHWEGSFAFKALRDVGKKWAVGGEYFTEFGRVRKPEPWREQNNTAYLVADYSGKPFKFNLGIGHGLTPASPRWTLKGVISLPFE